MGKNGNLQRIPRRICINTDVTALQFRWKVEYAAFYYTFVIIGQLAKYINKIQTGARACWCLVGRLGVRRPHSKHCHARADPLHYYKRTGAYSQAESTEGSREELGGRNFTLNRLWINHYCYLTVVITTKSFNSNFMLSSPCNIIIITTTTVIHKHTLRQRCTLTLNYIRTHTHTHTHTHTNQQRAYVYVHTILNWYLRTGGRRLSDSVTVLL